MSGPFAGGYVHRFEQLNIVCWQPALTDHQSHTLQALAKEVGAPLSVYVRASEHPGRASHGWTSRHAPTLSPVILPTANWVRDTIRRLREGRDATHIFGSPFEDVRLMVALALAAAMRLRIFLISEPYSPITASYLGETTSLFIRLKAGLRPVAYRLFGVLLRNRVAGVFAISRLAELQYRGNGFAADRVFPFAYFVPRASDESIPARSTGRPTGTPLRLIFVGALIPRKGIDVLIAAVQSARTMGADVTVDAYGGGDPARYPFDGKVLRYAGMIPFGTAQSVIAKYDVLVLPSRYDGWGVVVNEALLAGVPVICSSAVGAACLVGRWRCGSVFESEDVSALAEQLALFASHPEALQQAAAETAIAAASLDPGTAGRYMRRAIDGATPVDLGREFSLACA